MSNIEISNDREHRAHSTYEAHYATESSHPSIAGFGERKEALATSATRLRTAQQAHKELKALGIKQSALLAPWKVSPAA